MDLQVDEKRREKQLWKLAKKGSRNALASLLEDHRKWMQHFAMRLEGNEQDAADLLQEVYLKILGILEGFQGRSALKTWLYRVMVNLFLDRKRKRKSGLPLEEVVDRRAGNPLQEQIAQETILRVRKALNGLPPKQRAVLTLRVYEDLSYSEIARIVGISVDAVKMNAVYARKKMARLLGTSIT